MPVPVAEAFFVSYTRRVTLKRLRERFHEQRRKYCKVLRLLKFQIARTQAQSIKKALLRDKIKTLLFTLMLLQGLLLRLTSLIFDWNLLFELVAVILFSFSTAWLGNILLVINPWLERAPNVLDAGALV